MSLPACLTTKARQRPYLNRHAKKPITLRDVSRKEPGRSEVTPNSKESNMADAGHTADEWTVEEIEALNRLPHDERLAMRLQPRPAPKPDDSGPVPVGEGM